VQAHDNPDMLHHAFGAYNTADLDVQDSEAHGLVYVAPNSEFHLITGISEPGLYSLNLYGCPYDKAYNSDKCNTEPPPSCLCEEECTGYCAGMTSHNFALPNLAYTQTVF
jgi:hypothetical protein